MSERCYFCNYMKSTVFQSGGNTVCWECLLSRMGHQCDGSSDLAASRKRVEVLERVLLAISTDIAQDSLEDPVGFSAREDEGYVRLWSGTRKRLNAALASLPAKEAK